jgi:hypothetical protein
MGIVLSPWVRFTNTVSMGELKLVALGKVMLNEDMFGPLADRKMVRVAVP